MAIEMRLHRAWESDDPIKGEVHSRLWWNLYVLEKMISCEMGRPVLLRREETDCPYPSANEADEFELMSTNVGRGPAQFLNTRIKLRSISGLHTTIRLSFIMERIAREIYGISARKRIREDQSAGEAKRQELWYVLQDWEREMDASPLRLDLSKSLTSVPASVTNYVVRSYSLPKFCSKLTSIDHVARYDIATSAFHCSLGFESNCLRSNTKPAAGLSSGSE